MILYDGEGDSTSKHIPGKEYWIDTLRDPSFSDGDCPRETAPAQINCD